MKSGAWLRAVALALGAAPVFLTTASVAEKSTPHDPAVDVPLFVPVTPPQSTYNIEKVGNQGVKLSAKNSTNSYAITVLGSNAEAANPPPGAGEAWQKSLGVKVEGKLGSFVKTDLSTRFTELESSPDFGLFSPPSSDAVGVDRRALEEYSLTTQFLGDRVAVTSSRRASERDGLDPALNGKGGAYEQDKFNAWIWRSNQSSLSVEGVSNRVDSGFQSLTQAMQTRTEESQQVKSKLSYGRAGFFVAHHDASAFSPDHATMLSRQSDVETGATLGLSDLRQGGPLLYLLPDSVWVSTNRGSVTHGETPASEASPLEKSSIGMTRAWNYGSVNVSYWRSAVEAPTSVPDESQWRGHGMDVGGTLHSGPLSLSGNLSLYTADTIAALNNTTENNVNGSLFLTYSPTGWPKVSAGVTNYAYQTTFFDYAGLNQSSLMRYEVGIDSSKLLSAWANSGARLKFIASYQDSSNRSQWSQSVDTATGAQNVFFGFKLSRSSQP